MSLKNRIGEKAGPVYEEVSAERVALFRKALEMRSPYPVPPTFLTTCRKAEFELFNKFGIELSKILHAEQEYTYTDELQVSDRLAFYTTLTNVLEKSGSAGKMMFLTFETQFRTRRRDQEVTLGTSRTLVVIREGAPK